MSKVFSLHTVPAFSYTWTLLKDAIRGFSKNSVYINCWFSVWLYFNRVCAHNVLFNYVSYTDVCYD